MEMTCKLPADCLNQIFEYYDDDSMTNLQQIENKKILRSCLLVSRLWCWVAVRILWRTIQNYQTLVACLPIESITAMHANRITFPTPASNPPFFNYVPFVRTVSTGEICSKVGKLAASIGLRRFTDQKKMMVTQEIFKALMSQTSLRGLKMDV